MCFDDPQNWRFDDLEEIPQKGHFSYQKVNISTLARQVGQMVSVLLGLGMSPLAWERMSPTMINGPN